MDERKSVVLKRTSWETEIGDTKQPHQFFPQIKVKKWNNEANYSVRHTDDFSGIEPTTEGDVIKLIKPEKEIHIYEKKLNTYEYYRNENLHPFETVASFEYKKDPFSHILINDEIWARDDESERNIRREAAQKASGDVLVVGLGLGVINEYLKENRNVTSITIVEKSQQVIDLVREIFPERLSGVIVFPTDFFSFKTGGKYDYIYGDIFHVLDPRNFNAWERFSEHAKTLLAPEGIIEGRIKKIYDTTDPATYEEDTHEIEIILKEKPVSNILSFSVQSKDVEFFYQPELTPEEKKQGSIRLPHIVGSYALYSSKRNNQYQAGKVGHIYRPRIEDATGKKVWGDLHIENGAMTVTIPQEFIDNAVYPIRHAAGATFGYTTIGGSTQNGIGATIFVLPATSGSDAAGAAATKITVALNSSGTLNTKCKLYDGSNNPVTNGETNQNTTWASGLNDYTFPTPPTLAASTAYKICTWESFNKSSYGVKYDTGASGIGQSQLSNYAASWPNPLVPVNNTNQYTMYVTYTATQALTLALDQGSYALSGQAVNLTSARSILVALGTYILSGQDVLFSYGKTIAIAFGSYALTGVDAILAFGRGILLSFGSYALTGFDLTFSKAISAALQSGSYILMGIDALLRASTWINQRKSLFTPSQNSNAIPPGSSTIWSERNKSIFTPNQNSNQTPPGPSTSWINRNKSN